VDVQSGTLSIDSFSNDGMVLAQAGTRLEVSGGTSSGSFDVAAGAVMTVSGTSTYTPAATFTGAGTVLLSGSVVGTLNGGNFLLSSGTLSGTFTNAGTLTWTAGSITSGDITIASGGVWNIAGATDKYLVSGRKRVVFCGRATRDYLDIEITADRFVQSTVPRLLAGLFWLAPALG
jgi:hypothetical protein